MSHVTSPVVSTVPLEATGTSSRVGESSPSQPQHHTKPRAQPAAAVEADSENPAEIPLPSDLKRLLQEVAKTGACPWLNWDQEMSVSVPPSTLALGSASKPSTAVARQSFPIRSQGPPRKKHRNGVHKTNRRRSSDSPALKTASSRKRPLGFVRTSPSTMATNTNNISSAPSSVGSGRTSGSEPEDSTHYECDSEGTSTTSNSEMSVERLRKSQFLQQQSRRTSIASMESNNDSSFPYKTLQEAFRAALGIVLDHFYKHRGGYKLSPAEKRWNETLVVKWNSDKKTQSAEAVFQQRRQRLLHMLDSDAGTSFRRQDARVTSSSSGPPFTIQRIAEVLLSPDRYYTQTHKLCNCLEKLLLVRSSSEAFGGSTGGDTSQSRREEREMAALADEKGRQDSELRQRRLKMGVPSPTSDTSDSAQDSVAAKGGNPKEDGALNDNGKRVLTKDKKPYDAQDDQQGKKDDPTTEESTREQLEAAARASLRTKFDHVGIDPHHHSQDRDALSMAEGRRMTNSPPPPSLAMPPAPASIGLPGHSGSPGFSRQHLSDQAGENHHLARVPSPILFSSGNETSIHAAAAAASTNMHMLQIQHAVALSGALGRGTPSALELMAIDGTMRQHNNLASSVDNADGRSSTSNSDVDSESDDISLDDSASDRSDGSDSGSVTHYEPFTAARAMALNRMQQQQRLQSRVLTAMNMQQATEGFRLPPDAEYQSGDSIDSTRAEDFGGSDSSSSDLAD